MQPPAARRPSPLIENIQQHHRPAALASSVQRRIIGKAQIIPEPDKGFCACHANTYGVAKPVRKADSGDFSHPPQLFQSKRKQLFLPEQKHP